MDKSLYDRANKLQNTFLKNIDCFFKENKQENILTPITVLLSTVMILLKETNRNELIDHAEKMLHDTESLMRKVFITIQ